MKNKPLSFDEHITLFLSGGMTNQQETRNALTVRLKNLVRLKLTKELVKMKVTYLDLKTGKKTQESGISLFHLTEGNWSCDCNRGYKCGYDGYFDGLCDGYVRFIVIDVEEEHEPEFLSYTKEEIISLANSGYYYILENWRKIIYHGLPKEERPELVDNETEA